MSAPSSCNFSKPIPNPPTYTAACAVPIGGSNGTIFDTCCNGHINSIQNYGQEDDDEGNCYQYCNTNAVDAVMACLSQPQNLGPMDPNNEKWKCFNVEAGGSRKQSDYESAGMRLKGVGKWTMFVMGLGVIATMMNAS